MPILDRETTFCKMGAHRVESCRDGSEASGVTLGGAVSSTDLGSSSNYSNKNFEDRSGEGFHVNGIRPWVSRA